MTMPTTTARRRKRRASVCSTEISFQRHLTGGVQSSITRSIEQGQRQADARRNLINITLSAVFAKLARCQTTAQLD
jgi:hypothetical protein